MKQDKPTPRTDASIITVSAPSFCDDDTVEVVFADFARTLERELAEARGASQWLPMETAPKDGSLIVGFKFGMLPLVVTWLPRSENKSKNSDWWFSPLNPRLDLRGLTHWVPLPAAPNTSSQFSEFIRNATPEEKEVVYKRVMDAACDDQNKILAAATESPKEPKK